MREKNIKITGEKGAMNELALFAGAGGGILGGQLLGWRTVCAVEIEPYPASVLMQRQNDGLLAPFPIWDDVCTFDGRPWRGIVDVVSGGFPCQDISAAGKGAGIDGERSGLWAEFARIICEIQPRYAFIENSPMLTLRGLDRVLCDLAQMGFNAKWGVVSAADVGAPHRRERIWIVATNTYSNKCAAGNQQQEQSGSAAIADGSNDMANANFSDEQARMQSSGREARGNTDRPSKKSSAMADTYEEKSARLSSRAEAPYTGIRVGSQNVPDTDCQRRRGGKAGSQDAKDVRQLPRYSERCEGRFITWDIEPDVGRVANGVAARVDRLKAIGNGQVPQCAAEAWRLLNPTGE